MVSDKLESPTYLYLPESYIADDEAIVPLVHQGYIPSQFPGPRIFGLRQTHNSPAKHFVMAVTSLDPHMNARLSMHMAGKKRMF